MRQNKTVVARELTEPGFLACLGLKLGGSMTRELARTDPAHIRDSHSRFLARTQLPAAPKTNLCRLSAYGWRVSALLYEGSGVIVMRESERCRPARSVTVIGAQIAVRSGSLISTLKSWGSDGGGLLVDPPSTNALRMRLD